MLFTFVSFSLLLVSIIGITSLIVYKMLRVSRGMETVTYDSISPDDFRKKLVYFFNYTCKKGNHCVLSRVKKTFNLTKGRILDKHSTFTDRMNGKGNTSKKGAASFFLKSVSEHKKTFRRDNK